MPKKTGRYSNTDRLTAIGLAIETSVPAASKTLNIPESTIYTWFYQGGGVKEIRNAVEVGAAHALARSEQAIYEQVLKRAPNLSDAEIISAWRALVDHRLGSETVTQTVTSAVQVNVNQSEDRVSGIIGVLANSGLLQAPTTIDNPEVDIVHPPSTNGHSASSPDT